MKRNQKIKSYGGFSLAELLISIGLFLILITSLFGTLMIGLRTYRKNSQKSMIQLTVQNAVETMVNELRQATPNEDPGLFGNPPRGYKVVGSSFMSAQSPIDATGVIIPNVNEKSVDDSLTFNKPDYNYYKPEDPAWVPLDPRNFVTISYSVKNGNTIMREEVLYNSDGTIASKSEDPVAEIPEGTIKFTAVLVDKYGESPNLYQLNVPYYSVKVTAQWQTDTDEVNKKSGNFQMESVCIIPGNPQQ